MKLLLPLKSQAQKPQMKNKEICITIDSELFVSLFVRIVLTVYTTIVIDFVQIHHSLFIGTLHNRGIVQPNTT